MQKKNFWCPKCWGGEGGWSNRLGQNPKIGQKNIVPLTSTMNEHAWHRAAKEAKNLNK